jgi:hypothetical protein
MCCCFWFILQVYKHALIFLQKMYGSLPGLLVLGMKLRALHMLGK